MSEVIRPKQERAIEFDVPVSLNLSGFTFMAHAGTAIRWSEGGAVARVTGRYSTDGQGAGFVLDLSAGRITVERDEVGATTIHVAPQTSAEMAALHAAVHRPARP